MVKIRNTLRITKQALLGSYGAKMAKISGKVVESDPLELFMRPNSTTGRNLREVPSPALAPNTIVQFPPARAKAPVTVLEALKLPVRPVSSLTDQELANLIQNHRAKGKVEGALWPLKDIMREVQLRIASEWDTAGLRRVIFDNFKRPGDGLTTYKNAWHCLYPHLPFKGCNSKRIVMKALNALNNDSAVKGDPLWAVLVVPTGRRRLTDKAKKNLYEKARDLGRDVGPDIEQFIAQEIAWAREIIRSRLNL